MKEILAHHYLLLKALHLICVIAWMAGMFYLPRLFVYHTRTKKGSEMSETFKVMERRLLRIIINPAMVLSLITGILLIIATGAMQFGWFHAKLTLLVAMFASHGIMARSRRYFAKDMNTHSERFYRILNEVPTVLMIGIVLLVVLKPF
ncbi:MAG: protoporphyrinogen oxidase HemJ [Proteobacteria bacterium]|nr:protoporphyrinogen oxidase HemJ [Pseudomonadota bacterium]